MLEEFVRFPAWRPPGRCARTNSSLRSASGSIACGMPDCSASTSASVSVVCPPPKSLSSSESIARMCSDLGRCSPIVESSPSTSCAGFAMPLSTAPVSSVRRAGKYHSLPLCFSAVPEPSRQHFRVAADRRQRSRAVPAVQAVDFGCCFDPLSAVYLGGDQGFRRGPDVDRVPEPGFVGDRVDRRPEVRRQEQEASSSEGPLVQRRQGRTGRGEQPEVRRRDAAERQPRGFVRFVELSSDSSRLLRW